MTSNSLLESKIRRIVRHHLNEATSVNNFFDKYDAFDSSEVMIDELIQDIKDWIDNDVKQEDRKVANLAIKKLFFNKVRNW